MQQHHVQVSIELGQGRRSFPAAAWGGCTTIEQSKMKTVSTRFQVARCCRNGRACGVAPFFSRCLQKYKSSSMEMEFICRPSGIESGVTNWLGTNPGTGATYRNLNSSSRTRIYMAWSMLTSSLHESFLLHSYKALCRC